MSFKESLAVVGVLPPPYGGVSVSLARLLPYLESSGIDYVVYNTGESKVIQKNVRNIGWSLVFFLRLLFLGKHKLVHFNTSRWWIRLYGALLGVLTGSKIIITAHGYSLTKSLQEGFWLKRFLVCWSLKRVHRIIATNPDIFSQLVNSGIPNEKLALLPAFIPPPKLTDMPQIPSEIAEFCKDKKPLIAANGAYTILYGNDVYGLNAMVELIGGLKKEFPNIALVVFLRKDSLCFASNFSDLFRRVSYLGLDKNILFYCSETEFWPFLRLCDLFIRPTSTDGDANSIREAIFFEVPVIASDVVPRVNGCNLYKFADANDFEEVTMRVLLDLQNHKKALKDAKYNGADELTRLYNLLLNVYKKDNEVAI